MNVASPFTDSAPSVKAVAVTGASGFVGGHLIRHLSSRGHHVRALVRTLGSVDAGVAVPFGGLEDAGGLRRAMAGAASVVHLAARVHVMRDSASDPLAEHRRINVDGSLAVLRAAGECGLERMVFVSSVKAMGEDSGDTVWNESMGVAPRDPYGASKLEAELRLAEEAGEAGVELVVLRIPLVYGPGVGGNMIRLVKAVVRGIPLPFGAVRNHRSLLGVGNLCHAIAAVLQAGGGRAGTYVLSDGRDLSTPDLIRLIAVAAGKKPLLLPVPVFALEAVARVGDVLGLPLDSSALERLTGSLRVDSRKFARVYSYEPPMTPDEGIRAMVRWAMENA